MKIQPFISSLWQERWDKEVGNKLHAIMPQIDEKYYSGCTNRKDEVIINRLRIGHTRLTHSFRMENRPHPPLCDQCEGDHELTVKHILIECNFLKIIRRRHYDVTDLNQLFKAGVYTKFSGRLSEEPFTWLIQKFPCIFIFKTGQPGCQLNLSEGQIRLDLTSGRPLA